MVKKTAILIGFFYILALFQTSFLINFRALNIILILTIILNLFEKPEEKTGIISAIIVGFFLDVFSGMSLGFYILILFASSFFTKFILRRYLQLPILFKYESKS